MKTSCPITSVKMKFLIKLLILYEVTGIAFSASGSDAKALRQKLFVTDGYDRKVRPQLNQSEPIAVYVNLYLLSINQLDEVTETLKTTGFLWILWQDDFLQWNPASYGGLSYYHWPQGDVWKPDIALKNSYLEYKELGVDSLNVYVDSAGSVEWQPFQVFQSTCAVDITYFPYDIQTCEMKFVAWSYSKDEVIIESGAKGIEMEQYESNSEWKVINSSYAIEWETYEAAIVFKLKIQRKPLYVLLSVIMPIIMLAILNISVFLLPSDSGEKASYAVTVFLAFAVFLSIISSTLPENSDKVAIFSVYLIILTLESTIITLIALGLVRISSFDHNQSPVPERLHSFKNLVSFPKCWRKNTVSGDDIEEIGDDNVIVNANKKFSPKKIRAVTPTNVEIRSKCTWKDASNLLDKIFLVFFALVLSLSTMIFFLVTANNDG